MSIGREREGAYVGMSLSEMALLSTSAKPTTKVSIVWIPGNT